MIPTTTMTQLSTTTAAAPAKDKLSEIQSLTARVEDFGRSFNTWNWLYVWLVFAAVIVAAAVFMAQFLAIRKGRQLASAQSALLKAKDDNLTGELKDKDVKIADATKLGQEAKERAEKLEHDNLTLRGQVATLETNAAQAQKDVANLQKAASDAKAAQQRVETELAKQRERTAIAERSLLELQDKLRYRNVSKEQREAFIKATSRATKGEIEVSALSGDPESIAFAESLRTLVVDAGWTSEPVKNTLITGNNAIGLTLVFQSVEQLELDPRDAQSVVIPQESPVFHGLAIKDGFKAATIPLARSMSASKAPFNMVILVVGAKP